MATWSYLGNDIITIPIPSLKLPMSSWGAFIRQVLSSVFWQALGILIDVDPHSFFVFNNGLVKNCVFLHITFLQISWGAMYPLLIHMEGAVSGCSHIVLEIPITPETPISTKPGLWG